MGLRRGVEQEPGLHLAEVTLAARGCRGHLSELWGLPWGLGEPLKGVKLGTIGLICILQSSFWLPVECGVGRSCWGWWRRDQAATWPAEERKDPGEM